MLSTQGQEQHSPSSSAGSLHYFLWPRVVPFQITPVNALCSLDTYSTSTQEHSGEIRIAEPLSHLIYLSVLITTPQKEITSHGIGTLQDKNTFPYFCSPMLSHCPGLLAERTFLRPASQPNLVAILDNRHCPEKGKPDQGCTLQCLLTVGEATFLIVSLPWSRPGESQAPRTALPRFCRWGSH